MFGGGQALASEVPDIVSPDTDTYPVTVHELTGTERDRICDEQARRYPGFADYARQTAGVRTISVLALRRSREEAISGALPAGPEDNDYRNTEPLVGGGGFEPP